jgi:hypothetical protein
MRMPIAHVMQASRKELLDLPLFRFAVGSEAEAAPKIAMARPGHVFDRPDVISDSPEQLASRLAAPEEFLPVALDMGEKPPAESGIEGPLPSWCRADRRSMDAWTIRPFQPRRCGEMAPSTRIPVSLDPCRVPTASVTLQRRGLRQPCTTHGSRGPSEQNVDRQRGHQACAGANSTAP